MQLGFCWWAWRLRYRYYNEAIGLLVDIGPCHVISLGPLRIIWT